MGAYLWIGKQNQKEVQTKYSELVLYEERVFFISTLDWASTINIAKNGKDDLA